MIHLTILSTSFLIPLGLIFGKCLLTLPNSMRDIEEIKQEKVIVAKLILKIAGKNPYKNILSKEN